VRQRKILKNEKIYLKVEMKKMAFPETNFVKKTKGKAKYRI